MNIVKTLAEISVSIRNGFSQSLKNTDARINENILYVHSKVFALSMKDAYLRIQYLYEQIFATTADEKHLEFRHAPELNIARKAAGFAAGNIKIYAKSGVTLPKGLVFISGGLSYVSLEAVTAAGFGYLTLKVRCLTSGVEGNRIEGEALALADPSQYPLLETEALVLSGDLAGGVGVEGVDALRQRVLDKKRNPPQGGAWPDYERWAKELPSVSAAWARRPVNDSGSVAIWFLNGEGDIPTQSEIDALDAHLATKRIIGLRHRFIYAPVDEALTVQLSISPDTPEMRIRISNAILADIAARRRPGLPAEILGGSNDDFVLFDEWISEAVSRVAGEVSHNLVLPADNVTYSIGEMPMTVSVVFS